MLFKKCSWIVLIIVVFTAVGNAEEHVQDSYKPESGYVPDEVTAVKITEAVLVPIYGKEVLSERPFKAELKDGVWYVSGTLHCMAANDCAGGVAEVEIKKDNGEILRVIHWK